jgi:hypothetical protein
MASPSRWHRIVREPLLHFVVLGTAIFAVDHLVRAAAPVTPTSTSTSTSTPTSTSTSTSEQAPPAGERRVVVTRSVRDELALGFERAEGHAPSAAELDAAVARWVDEEILYREGRRRGFERDDPRVRDRIASKMAFVIRAQVVVPEPTDEDLRTFLSANAERFTAEERVDFTHVFVTGAANDPAAAARARDLHTQLLAGTSPNRLGDTFTGGRRYRRRTFPDLARTFGDSFATGLGSQAPGTWAIHTSRFGHHIVRIDERIPAGVTDFATLRPDLRTAWMDARRDEETTRAVEALRSQWQIERE